MHWKLAVRVRSVLQVLGSRKQAALREPDQELVEETPNNFNQEWTAHGWQPANAIDPQTIQPGTTITTASLPPYKVPKLSTDQVVMDLYNRRRMEGPQGVRILTDSAGVRHRPYEEEVRCLLAEMSSEQDPKLTKDDVKGKGKEAQATPDPDQNADASEFHSFLLRCADEARAKHGESAPYIHPVVLSFSDGAEKANWRAYFEDAGERDVFSQLWKSKKTTAAVEEKTPDVWLALCATKAENWVGKKGSYDIKNETWHAWAVAIVRRKDGRGRHVLIFDPDKAKEPKNLRYRTVLLGSQRSFVETAMRAIDPRGGQPTGGLNGPALRVWLGGGTLDGLTIRGKDQCVAYSTQWLRRIAQFASEGSHGDDILTGPRFGGCDFTALQS